MRNILKGFLNPKAEEYIFPDADTIEMEAPPVPGDQPGEEPAGEEAGFDYTEPAEDGQEEPEAPPALEEETADGGEPSQSGSGGVVQYAQLQAELILKQAREEAETLVEQARANAKAEQEQIRAGARDEGYRVGYAEGTAKAMEDAVRDREATAARLEQEVQTYLEKADMAREEMLLQSREELLDLCLAVAEKVVRVSLRSSRDVVVRMIQAATERLKRQEWVHIYISGCDAKGAAQISPALTTALGALSQHVKIVPMGDDESGTCIVETPEEIIDASVSTQMSNIRDILRDQMGAL